MLIAWIVVMDSHANYQVRKSTADLEKFDEEVITLPYNDIAQDMAATLNVAHERRLWPDSKSRLIATDMGAMPCCEDAHKGVVCTICDDHRKTEKYLSIPGIPVPCCEDSYNNGACIVCGKSDQ